MKRCKTNKIDSKMTEISTSQRYFHEKHNTDSFNFLELGRLSVCIFTKKRSILVAHKNQGSLSYQ